MNDQTAIAERRPAPIELLKSTVARKADDFKMVLPSHITVDKFQRTIATAALSNAQLLNCDRQSLLIAAMKLAQDGLLPDGREAALVPFKNRVKGDDGQFHDVWQVQAMPMAWGLRKKILQSGQVISLETGVVYRAEMEGGHFIYEIGLEPPIRHRPKLDMTDEEMADEHIVAAYSIARLKNDGGDPYWSVEVMRRSEINKVRQTSQTGAVGRVVKFGKDKGKPIQPKGPWVDWFGEMARKTVLRRHSKVLPMSGDLLDTLERDDAEEQRAQGAARLLEAEEVKPVALPSAEDLSGDTIDQETGEIIQTDSRGMTQVDEETARALDASGDGEATGKDNLQVAHEAEPQRASKGKGAQADYFGSKPVEARPGESWYNPDDEKLRYAHQTQHGIKWYLNPPAQPDEGKSEAEIAEQTARDIDGPLDEQSNDEPPYAELVKRIEAGIESADNEQDIEAVKTEYAEHALSLPAEVAGGIEKRLRAKRQALADGEG